MVLGMIKRAKKEETTTKAYLTSLKMTLEAAVKKIQESTCENEGKSQQL
jgi:hypothetical protein